jgi:hypothetical protein
MILAQNKLKVGKHLFKFFFQEDFPPVEAI